MKPHASNKFKRADYIRNVFAITPPPGVTIEDMKERAYWTNVAASLTPMSRIEVLPRDGSFFAEFIVTASGKNWAEVILRDFVELVKHIPAELKSVKYKVLFQGGDDGWAVIRNSDKVVLGNGFDNSAEAQTWMEAYDPTTE